jgi:uncharacterized protein (TIGR03067 family)
MSGMIGVTKMAVAPHTWYLLVILVVPTADSDDAVKKEKKALAGGWTVVTAQRDGEAIPDEEARKLRLSFAEERLTLKQGEKTSQLQYRLELDSNPRRIELIAGDGPNKGKPLPAIYELKGDSLKVCLPLSPDVGRPEGFSTASGSGLMLLVLKREK